MSRLPVREALLSLEAEGIILTVPRRGAFVAPLSPEDVRDHYQVYGLVSSVAAERAATLMIDADLQHLCRVHAAMAKERDPERQADLSFDFHGSSNLTGHLVEDGRRPPVLAGAGPTVPGGGGCPRS